VRRIASIFRKAWDVARMLARGNWRRLIRAARLRLHSDYTCLGLRRDARIPFSPPAAAIPITVRPLAPGDDLSILDVDAPGLSGEIAFTRLRVSRLLQSGISTCFAAIGPDGKPCHLQWLITAKENPKLRAEFGDLFPALEPDQAMIEGAYTPERLQRLGVMAEATARIASRAPDFGASWVLGFTEEDNHPSLKAAKRAGFTPYLRRVESWRLFRRRISFTPLPEGTPFPFEPHFGGAAAESARASSAANSESSASPRSETTHQE
jgi:hypothetical protein